MAYAGLSTNSITVPRPFAWSGRVFRFVGRTLSRVSSDPLPDLGGRPVLLVANHRSLADVFYAVAFLSAWGYPAQCLARHTYFDNRALGAWLRATGFIPAGGGGTDAVAEAVGVLRAGRPVAVMPEGRIVPSERRLSDGLGEFRDGFVTIAREAEVSVLPVALHGADRVWRSNAALPRFSLRRPRVTVRVGTPIDVAQTTDTVVEQQVRSQMATMLARP